ncbi:hypothetical protein CPB85DRAFT_1296652, partial [Mucidula mucida]
GNVVACIRVLLTGAFGGGCASNSARRGAVRAFTDVCDPTASSETGVGDASEGMSGH